MARPTTVMFGVWFEAVENEWCVVWGHRKSTIDVWFGGHESAAARSARVLSHNGVWFGLPALEWFVV